MRSSIPKGWRGLVRHVFVVVFTIAPLGTATAQIVADFDVDRTTGWVPFPVAFTNLSTYPPDPNVEFFWDFGDGEFSTSKNPTHLYSKAGVFTVSLAVHAYGEVETITRQHLITTLDLAVEFSASPTMGPAGMVVQFADGSQPGGFPATYLWDFGDGQFSTQRDPEHMYEVEGVYDVSLTVAIEDGPTKALTKPEFIHVVPFVPFLRLAQGCENVATHFPTIETRVFIHTDLGRSCLLGIEDVAVVENGVPQQVEAFFCNPTLNQADFVFVVDKSGSMGDDIEAVRQGAAAFAAHAEDVGVDAQFALIAYELEPDFVLDLTADVSKFESALDSVVISGGTEPALDTVLYALNTVAFRPCAQKMIVLVTDELTNGDKHAMGETVDRCQEDGAAVISISTDFADAFPETDVKQLAIQSGGLWFDILGADYPVILEEIVDFALAGWILRYTTVNELPPGTEREVLVSVHDPFRGTDHVRFTYAERPEFLELRNEFRALDLNGDGQLSPAEAGVATFTFNELDLNGDGYLALSELLAKTVGGVGEQTPVWVDFSYAGSETGQQSTPFNTLDEGVSHVEAGGELRITAGQTASSYTGYYAIRKPLRIVSTGGVVRIGSTAMTPASKAEFGNESVWPQLLQEILGK